MDISCVSGGKEGGQEINPTLSSPLSCPDTNAGMQTLMSLIVRVLIACWVMTRLCRSFRLWDTGAGLH